MHRDWKLFLDLRARAWLVGGLFLLGLWAPGLAEAQTPDLQRPAAPRYDVVALRIEFQPDTTRFTTGNGTFSGALYADTLAPSIDPLPHDADYFQAHLDFLADYVASVSGGRTRLTTHLIPEVVRVSQEMGAYSPTGPDADSDAERAKLAALVAEAWPTAAAQTSFDPSMLDPERTIFVLFHAGVGRDIELLGTTLDKTPLDLPSLTFSEEVLTALTGGPVLLGPIPVRNTLLIPRTETRQGFNFIEDEPFLLELSTNGLLAASLFNALGVPDLFDTETGQPAIGPFGLMDPLGIFTYNGLFPPEPMAWTKYFLGWIDPQELRGNAPLEVELTAAKTGAPALAARASISSTEYFLIENRNRDPEGDGLVMRVWKDGAIVEQRVPIDSEEFTRFDVGGFVGGVVVGVDNYDWGLPGGLDEDGNVLEGGILIWHIDERRLAEAFASGRGPNADVERRAIDLEEADSAQDLGFPSPNPFGPAADQGTPFDFWYEGNPVAAVTQGGRTIRLYENRFGPDTFPNSNSNAGGPSFIVLEDFSPPGATMSFTFRREGEGGVAPVLSQDLTQTEARVDFSQGGLTFEEGTGDLLAYDGQVFVQAPSNGRPEFLFGSFVMPVVLPGASAAFLTRSDEGDYLLAGGRFKVQDTFLFTEIATLPPSITPLDPTPALVGGTDGSYHLLFGGGGEAVHVRVGEADLQAGETGEVTVTPVPDVGRGLFLALTDENAPLVVGTRGAAGPGVRWDYTLSDEARLGGAAFGREASGIVGAFAEAGTIYFLLADGAVEVFEPPPFLTNASSRTNPFVTLADLDEDGRLDAVTTIGQNLVAVTQGGAFAQGFPKPLPSASQAQVLLATMDGQPTAFVAGEDGYLHALDLSTRGRQQPGFPVAVGSSARAVPLLQAQTLYAVSLDGQLSGWQLDTLGEIAWGEIFGDARHTSFVVLDAAPQPPAAGASLIVEEETYNWPNPIRDGQTFLRCQTTTDARVRVTIVDAAGSLIDTLEFETRGGVPAEHAWQTDASSGLYYARVEATSGSSTATTLVKMAIIR